MKNFIVLILTTFLFSCSNSSSDKKEIPDSLINAVKIDSANIETTAKKADSISSKVNSVSNEVDNILKELE